MMPSSPRIPGLSEEHQAAVSRLVGQMQAKAHRNRLRRRYYDYKVGLRDLGIAIPPSMRTLDTVLGWPAKAVDSMVRRTVLDKWTTGPGVTADDLGLTAVWDANRMDTELPAGLTSTLMHAVTFGFVTAGDTAAGEPPVVVTLRSAEWATGTWDARRRCLKDALSIRSVDDRGVPDDLALYLPGIVVLARRDGVRWDLRQVTHDLGVPVEPIPFRPLLDRPFGSSRISRPVMALTDAAVRTLARTEVGAEFYNAPQRYALGADEKAFQTEAGDEVPGWQVRLGALLTLTRDEDGQLPAVGQFAQQSMEPNIGQMNMISRLFSAETNLPLRSLGVMGDNPESAESQRTAERDFALEITAWQKGALTPALRRLMTYALRVVDDSPAALAVYGQVRPHWARPDLVSPAEAADAVVKLNAAIQPGSFGESDVGLEMAGLEAEQIERWRAERGQAQARAAVSTLLGPEEVGGAAAAAG